MRETWDWYEGQRSGLGDQFEARVSAAIEGLAANPRLFATIWEDVRACRLRKYPYVVYYRALEDRVEVLAILHGNRDSAAWQSRV